MKPSGRLYFHDCRPFGWALHDDGVRAGHTYFEESASHVGDSGETYTDSDVDSPPEHTRTYEWNHARARS